MKTFSLTIALTIGCFIQLDAQINPILNLEWQHTYESPNNYFELSWEEPATPHDQLIGYNIYRNNDLYRFQTETSLYHWADRSNCGIDFLLYKFPPFLVHVTAVYEPGPVESGYDQTIEVMGAVVKVDDYKSSTTVVYPNPSNGKINVVSKNLSEIQVFDGRGRKIKSLIAEPSIDLSEMAKGIYFLKLISENGVSVNKIILE